jgi:cytidylate kinase
MIAEKLNILHLDTGAMYRAVALKAIRDGVSTSDRDALKALVENIDLKVEFIDGKQLNILDGYDVGDRIRNPDVSKGSSAVAVFPEVRYKMVELQREIAAKIDIIMDGRDIGTYVLPDADLKIFLTASVAERSGRRLKQQEEKGLPLQKYEEVVSEIEYRDKNDSSREVAPLKRAEDAYLIDSTGRTPESVTAEIMKLLREKGLYE